MNKMKTSFWNSPVNWLVALVMHSKLPVLWKAQVAVWNMKWWTYKRHFKDQFLGELVVITVSVDKDWEYIQGKHTQTRVRDIVYRWKRRNLPFAYRKKYSGTQCTDETAHPLGRIPHDIVATVNDKVFECNQEIRASNEKHEKHQKLKASIVNHQFQEYDHEVKN
jgi:hypothetical protein